MAKKIYPDAAAALDGLLFDGMTIAAGDLILGDDDGLLAVPYEQAEAIYQAAAAKHDVETKMLADIAAGTLDTSWIDARLRALGCSGV